MKSIFISATSVVLVMLFFSLVLSCRSVTAPPKQKNNKGYQNSSSSSVKSQNYKTTKHPSSSDKSGITINAISLPPLFQKTFSSIENMRRKLSIIHLYVVHFPIVLIFLAPIFWTLNYFKPRPEFLFSAKLFLWLGFVSIIIAMITGHGVSSSRKEAILLEQHAIWGELVVWCMGAAIVIRVFLKRWSVHPWHHYSIVFFLILANITLWLAISSGNALLGF